MWLPAFNSVRQVRSRRRPPARPRPLSPALLHVQRLEVHRLRTDCGKLPRVTRSDTAPRAYGTGCSAPRMPSSASSSWSAKPGHRTARPGDFDHELRFCRRALPRPDVEHHFDGAAAELLLTSLPG